MDYAKLNPMIARSRNGPFNQAYRLSKTYYDTFLGHMVDTPDVSSQTLLAYTPPIQLFHVVNPINGPAANQGPASAGGWKVGSAPGLKSPQPTGAPAVRMPCGWNDYRRSPRRLISSR